MKTIDLLNDLIQMLDQKMDLLLIKACAASIGFKLSSMTAEGMRAEVISLIGHVELEMEAETLVIL